MYGGTVKVGRGVGRDCEYNTTAGWEWAGDKEASGSTELCAFIQEQQNNVYKGGGALVSVRALRIVGKWQKRQ